MPVEIIHNVNRVTAKLDAMPRELEQALSFLVTEVVDTLSFRSQRNVTTQGAEFGKRWAENSKWIKAKKGFGHKTLEGTERYIRGSLTSRLSGRVAFYSPGKYTLSDHQKGFDLAASGKEVEIDLKAPSALGLTPGTNRYKFVWRRNSKVPARQIWPTEQQAFSIATSLLEKWASQTSEKLA